MVRAQLDHARGQILLPLEKYAMSNEELLYVMQANAIIAGECMAERGLEYPRRDLRRDTSIVLPDRRYGAWSKGDAEANGYEMPEDPAAVAMTTLEESFGERWWDAAMACVTAEGQLPLMGINSTPEQTVVDRGMAASFESLRSSEIFRVVRDEWKACIEAEGLAAHPDAAVLVPQFPEPGEQQLQVAAIDVECKDQHNSIQRLADFETNEQLSYVDEHESDLVAYRAHVDDVLARARTVIATGEG